MQPDLQECFAQAPFVENGWTLALEELARRTRSARAQILGLGGPQSVPFNYITNLGDVRHLQDFVEIGGADSAVNWRVAATRGPFELVAEEDYAPLRRSGRYAIYEDFIRHCDMMHGCQTLLAAGGGEFLGLATLRTERDGRTSDEDRRLFAAVAPAVLRAIRLQQAVNHRGAEMLQGALDAVGTAAFLLDDAGHVIAMTGAADREVSGRGVIALRKRILKALDRQADARLQAAIARLLCAPAGRAAERLWLDSRIVGAPGQVCELYPMPPVEWSFGAAPRLMIALRGLDRPGEGAAHLLRDAFRLSPSEAQVALMIARGLSRSDVAQERGVRPETINDQLKSIFRKTDVRREAEMVALVTRLAGN